ncbi:MAG: hypothetical protein AAFQ43_14385, partial [Bacteroidota bacterium]
QMVSDSGVPRYLSYSPDEGWLIQTPIRPTPKVGMMWIDVPEGKAMIKERSPAKITAMRGEFTFRPQLNKTLKVVEAARGDQHYSAELTADELEIVGGPKVKERELWTAFGREDKLREMDERAERMRKRRKAMRLAAIPCFIASVLYFVAAGWAGTKDGSVISSSTTEFVSDLSGVPTLPPRDGSTIERRDSLGIGTVNVDSPGSVYEVNVETVDDGSYPFPTVYFHIEEPDGDVHQLGRLFNRGGDVYSGTDRFRPTVPGAHELIAFIDEDSPDRLTFTTTVRTGMWDAGPFGMASGIAGLLGLVLVLGGGFGRIE